MRRFISFLFIALVAVACGGDKGGNVTPLTGEQKSDFKLLTQSVANTTGAAMTAYGAYALADVQADTQAGMAQFLVERKCDIQWESPQIKPGAHQERFYLNVKGDNCPVDLMLDINATFSDQYTMDLSLEATYQVKDAEFAKLNDVVGYAYKGTVSSRVSQSGATAQGSSSINISGKVLSTKYGQVPISVVGAGQIERDNAGVRGGGDVVARLELPAYTVELKSKSTVVNNQFETKLTLNGDEISALDYAEYTQSFTAGRALPH